MEIAYYGHSCFKLKGKTATVIMDPYDKQVGFSLPKLAAEIVTVSHAHSDHNAIMRVGGTTKRQNPYVISAPGEYEVSEVGVFGWGVYHDEVDGKERGKNTIFVVHMDNLSIAHLGDLGHRLSDTEIEHLGIVDILMVPVGGYYTIDAKTAVGLVEKIKPSMVIPMHYKTERHNQDTYGKLNDSAEFMKLMEAEVGETRSSLKITDLDLPEETEVVLLKPAE